MALQGTIDSFALPDVLQLLAATGKAGRLRVTGDRGSGSLWVDNGAVNAGELMVRGVDSDDLVEMLYHLLRFNQGSFTFDGDAKPEQSTDSIGVDELISRAEAMLADWRELEQVLPSLDSVLTLAPSLSGPDVVIDAAGWQVIARIGSGATAAHIGNATGLGEIQALRAIKSLIDSHLAVVTEPSTEVVVPERQTARVEGAMAAPHVEGATAAAVEAPEAVAPSEPPADAEVGEPRQQDPEPVNRFAPMADPAPQQPEAVAPPEPAAPEQPARAGWSGTWESASDLAPPSVPAQGPRAHASTPVDDLYVDDRSAGNHSFGDKSMPAPSSTELRNGLASMPLSQEPAEASPSDSDPSEIARQLASLSPRAAKAVAAAAKATTSEERDAALATIEAEDQNINRGLLLKFLGTVDS